MNDYFCVLPFFGAEYDTDGLKTPCCLLPAHSNISQIQTEMLAGERPIACQKCWGIEDQGKISDRQLKNSAFDYYKNKDIKFIEKDCQEGKFSPQIIKLYTSNLCNSTCVSCHPNWSTAWATLKKTNTMFKIISDSDIESLDYANFVMLNFVGGEPLYEKKNFEILQKLIDIGNLNCFISFTSNGSTTLKEYQKELLSKFKNLNICLSIDGIEKRFEYMRYPLKWDTLLENIDFFRKNDTQLSASFTISNLNIMYYQETVDWFNLQGLEHNHIMVSNPEYFAPNSLPLEIKKIINNKINLIDEHSEVDDQRFIEACKEIKYQDKLKKISIKDYLPDFYNIIPESLR